MVGNRKGEVRRPSTQQTETSETPLSSVAHDTMALPVLTNANHQLRACLELRNSEKTVLRRQPHNKAQQKGSAGPQFFSAHKKGDDTFERNHQMMMMISPTIPTTTMKHHDQASWDNSTSTSRPRSRAIAIKRSKRQDTGDDDFPDYSDQAARMYDDSTWAMYQRIVEYRQKNPVSSTSIDRARTGVPLNRLNDNNMMGERRGLHDKEDARGVNFYDTDEEEIFDLEL